MSKFQLLKLILLFIPLFGMVTAPIYADNKNHRPDTQKDQPSYKQKKTKDYRFDNRYRHDRYYPSRGFKLKRLPQRHYPIRFHNRPYFYSSGIWYLRSGVQFIVTAPPIGIIAPFLPSFYTTLWLRGVPYYYANDVYYVWQPEQNGYVVTNPPQGINEEDAKPLAEHLFIYPKQGQSEKQQADDRYECHRWSVEQTGYDPSQPSENMARIELAAKHDNYQKALKVCLEGRGYSVR